MEAEAQIRDPGSSQGHAKPKATRHGHRLPPVEGVGWVDADVEDSRARRARSAVTPVEEVEARPLPRPISGVTGMEGWESMVGWAELMLRHAAPAAAARKVDPDPARNFERLGQSILKKTEDHLEGARSFVEKRPPQFTGR